MVDKKRAAEILRGKMADNLVIVDSYETPDSWCFGLGLKNDDGTIMSLMGDSTIHVSKETGEIE